ncbi:hypothetical protein [Novosphingobium huizhouense]|uniref:hypothetical protein n=1 Tax=Novosphingobium huizhouense TaxID=2866625 RepID=UPI001CD851BD|nr:hypothetical protein [Novosphingobium huizhouense]
MGSRLSSAAQRLRSAAISLTSTEDVALINRFADELDSLSSKEEQLKKLGLASERSGTSEALRACLSSAFPLPEDNNFRGLLALLEEAMWDEEKARSQPSHH